MINYLKKIFKKTKVDDFVQTEALRLEFKERYHTFKLLLTANNAALENFAQLERLLSGDRLFGMNEIKTTVTAASVNIFRMIRKMDRLSPNKYKALLKRFDAIQNDINLILNETCIIQDERLVIDICEIDKSMSDSVGQKMANLGEIKNVLGLDTPDGFVITAHACEMFLRHNALQIEINRRLQTTINDDLGQLYLCSQTIQQLIINSQIPPDLEAIVQTKIKAFHSDKNNITFAIRSSALGEDSSDASFAGQFKSLLNVSVDHIFQAYKEIIASKYSLTAINYRVNRGFKDEDILMSVGCLAMVDALSGGVAYTHNPFQIHDDSIYIQSTWGLPKSIVDGSTDSDLFVISRSPEMHIRDKEIKKKEKKFTCYPKEGVCKTEIVDEFQLHPSISEKDIICLAHLAEKIELHYGVPQDIEWVLSNDDSPMIYLLQSRPLNLKTEQKRYTHDSSQINLKYRLAKQGVMASPGIGFGQAYIASKEVDLLRFPENAVLVINQARPEWAPLLSKAAAVISEKGGFAGHLANVARELGIPAIFGVTDICQKIKPGEMLTIDSEDLSIYRGKIKNLLDGQLTPKKMMVDTPVFTTLKRINKHITHLNLLDPDSADFRGQNCQTLHDITRFIHEKSIGAMFNFGKSTGLDEMSSKQLHYGVPMKWWILNLDDGFKKEIEGKYVYMDDIVSVPMIALWEGIIAVPWDGPPPVDKKGFMSVMFQATANTALNTGVRTKYSERNYFMISSKYCSLSSRLGFHFTTLESYIGDRVPENYISFRFQGGATDHSRRLKRVHFIGDFLKNYGFKIKIRNDNLNARLKGYEKEYMLERLKIIGYLTIHTRQLDMVISNRAMIKKYRNKFNNDIETILKIKSVQQN